MGSNSRDCGSTDQRPSITKRVPSGVKASLMYGAKGSGYLGRYNKFWGAMASYTANGWDEALC